MPKIGDVVYLVPAFMFCAADHSRNIPMKGIVRWVHPKGQYYMAVFNTRGGEIKECFFPDVAPNVGTMTEEKERRAWHRGLGA